jgi:hypothetical protein
MCAHTYRWAASGLLVWYLNSSAAALQAIDRQSSSHVALKVYHTGRLHELNRYQVLREVYLHAHLQHVNIIQMYAAFQVRWWGCCLSCSCMCVEALCRRPAQQAHTVLKARRTSWECAGAVCQDQHEHPCMASAVRSISVLLLLLLLRRVRMW